MRAVRTAAAFSIVLAAGSLIPASTWTAVAVIIAALVLLIVTHGTEADRGD